jgi:hypothetical protein
MNVIKEIIINYEKDLENIKVAIRNILEEIVSIDNLELSIEDNIVMLTIDNINKLNSLRTNLLVGDLYQNKLKELGIGCIRLLSDDYFSIN